MHIRCVCGTVVSVRVTDEVRDKWVTCVRIEDS
jgi:hypothetical protein